MIIIIDYGMGNLGSILNMFKKIGAQARVSSDVREIKCADKLILPGVGAFDTGMKCLEKLRLIDVLNGKVLSRKASILGICLGMHLLMERSEEGDLPGLGWIHGEAIRFSFDPKQTGLKIPHMGWNSITVKREDPLLANLNGEERFYFVHSYHVVCDDPSDVLGTTEYGYAFASVIRHENIMGVQFHPEKSHRFGMAVLRNFAEMQC